MENDYSLAFFLRYMRPGISFYDDRLIEVIITLRRYHKPQRVQSLCGQRQREIYLTVKQSRAWRWIPRVDAYRQLCRTFSREDVVGKIPIFGCLPRDWFPLAFCWAWAMTLKNLPAITLPADSQRSFSIVAVWKRIAAVLLRHTALQYLEYSSCKFKSLERRSANDF